MSNSGKVRMLLAVLSVSLLVSAAAAGCTPESPPLPPLTEESTAVSQVSTTEVSKKGSGADEEKAEESSIASEPERGETSVREGSEDEPASAEGEAVYDIFTSLWDENVDVPVTIAYEWYGEGGSEKAQTTDGDMIAKLRNAVCEMRATKKTDGFVYDNSSVLTFWDRNGKSFSLSFEGDLLRSGGDMYETEGFDKLNEAVSEMVRDYSGDNMQESFTGFTDKELDDMSAVDERVKELLDKEEYKSADPEKKSEMAEALLEELADEGLVQKGSICKSDDMISYRYSSGVLGGLMLRGFDPMMN